MNKKRIGIVLTMIALLFIMAISPCAAFADGEGNGGMMGGPGGMEGGPGGMMMETPKSVLTIMNPVNYIVGENQGDVAGYWRLASGSKDGDLSSSSAWLLANLLESYRDADVTFQITWEKPHGTAEYTMYDQMDWIVGVTALMD